MLKDRYVVMTLPDTRPKGDLGPDLLPLQHGSLAVPSIEMAELSQLQLKEIEQDGQRTAAPVMPWTLIDPVALEEPELSAESSTAWGVEAVGATETDLDGSGIVVAVLDTGIDSSHPAFAGMNIERRNFTSESDEDTNGHGTHCAGTIFGKDVGGLRIGVARGVDRALIGKVLGQGSSTQGIIDALNWVITEGAHVISMSLGIDFPGYVAALMSIDGLSQRPATSVALEAYRKNVNLFSAHYESVIRLRELGDGIVFVAASGNESRRPHYEIAAGPPAAATDILAVGALSRGEGGHNVADFSNTQVNISAPGVDIISANAGGGLVSMSGTSMATPHVAGVAALWAQYLQALGQFNSDSLRAKLISSATPTPLNPSHRSFERVGMGIVQAP